MKRLLGIATLAAFVTAPILAQGPSRTVTPDDTQAVETGAKGDGAQPIPDDAKRVLLALQQRDAGLADAAAVLQKERDAIAAEWNRTIARLQAAAPAGMELSPQLTYVVKKPDKRETPK